MTPETARLAMIEVSAIQAGLDRIRADLGEIGSSLSRTERLSIASKAEIVRITSTMDRIDGRLGRVERRLHIDA